MLTILFFYLIVKFHLKLINGNRRLALEFDFDIYNVIQLFRVILSLLVWNKYNKIILRTTSWQEDACLG